MKTVITGGIGAGKSYVCRWLQARGTAIYDCDAAAKRLMRTSEPLQQALIRLVGKEVYDHAEARAPSRRRLNKAVLAQFLLASDAHAQAVNDLVHPAVAADFVASGLDWMECAIYFDSGFDRRVRMDNVVCVAAPLEIRLRRIMERDGITRERALEWVNRQLPQEEVMRRSNFVVVNDGTEDLDRQLRLLTMRLQEKEK